jgi:hypothetical protein
MPSIFPVERQAEIWQAIAERAQQYSTQDGSFHTENELMLMVGQR